MDATVRKKDVWMVGGAFLLSSSLLWLVLRSLLARGSLTQVAAPPFVLGLTGVPDSLFPAKHLHLFNPGSWFIFVGYLGLLRVGPRTGGSSNVKLASDFRVQVK